MTRYPLLLLSTTLLLPLLDGCALMGERRGDKESEAPQRTIGDLRRDQAVEIATLEPASETSVSQDRARAAEHYRALLDPTPAEPLRPEAMRRIADLQLERDVDNGSSDHSAAIALYRERLERYPDLLGNDRVRYQLARAYEMSGEGDKALTAMGELVERHPDSPYAVEAWFRRGEYAFVQRDYSGAESAYRKVVQRGSDSLYYERALYKLGWAHFKQSAYNEALDTLLSLLDRTVARNGGNALSLKTVARAEREMLDDTLRVIALSLVYLGGHDELDTLIKARSHASNSTAYAELLYGGLGELHLEKERYSDAAGVFQAFVDHFPNHARSPDFQLKIIDIYRKARFPSLALEARKRFVEQHSLKGAFWQRHRVEDFPEVIAALKQHLTDLARSYHASAQQLKKKKASTKKQQATVNEAIRWYRLYLTSFPDEPQSPAIHFMLAELLFEQGDYAAAVVAYEQTAYDYASHEKSAESAYAAVLSHEKLLNTLTAEQRAVHEETALLSAGRFTQQFPQHPEALKVLARSASQLYQRADYSAAIAASQQILNTPSSDRDLQQRAATIVADAHFERADYAAAESAYRHLLTLPVKEINQRHSNRERLAASIYKQAEQALANKQQSAAIDHFLRIAKSVPDSQYIATAHYDAAATLMAMKQWQRAADILESLRRDYPKDDRQNEITQKLAVIYLELDSGELAAEEFHRITQSAKDPELQRRAAWQSAELFLKAERHQRAIDGFKVYIKQFPAPYDQALEARHHLVELYHKGHNKKRADYWRGQIVSGDAAAGKDRNDRSIYLAATASLVLLEDETDRYRAVALKRPLKKSLKLKKQRLQQAIKALEHASSYGVAEVTTESTYRTAELYRDFSQSLLDSERPVGLSADELAEYGILLEDQAYPFEEKAIAIHASNLQHINSDIYDDAVKRSLQVLAELMPVRYAKQEIGESLFLRKHVLGIQAQASGKYLTRPFMPAAPR
ncbi:hypothetical protein BOW53_11100, partial [Solemya pervernicosa gill symbiont]